MSQRCKKKKDCEFTWFFLIWKSSSTNKTFKIIFKYICYNQKQEESYKISRERTVKDILRDEKSFSEKNMKIQVEERKGEGRGEV